MQEDKFCKDRLLYLVSEEAEKNAFPSLILPYFVIEAKRQLPACKKNIPIPLTCYPILYKMKEAAVNGEKATVLSYLREIARNEDLSNGSLLYNLILIVAEVRP